MVEGHKEDKAGVLQSQVREWLVVLLREERIVNEEEWNWWECMTNSVKRGNGTYV